MSRRSPYFNRENLEKALPTADIQYVWMKTLGGRRKKIRDDTPNVGLRSLSFRNYADYTLTGEFQNAAAELVKLADTSSNAFMCDERVLLHIPRFIVYD